MMTIMEEVMDMGMDTSTSMVKLYIMVHIYHLFVFTETTKSNQVKQETIHRVILPLWWAFSALTNQSLYIARSDGLCTTMQRSRLCY